jgi:hypothetical protein
MAPILKTFPIILFRGIIQNDNHRFFNCAILAIFAVAVIGQWLIIFIVPLAIIAAVADYIKKLRNK